MRADHALVRAKPISRHFNDNFGCIHSANKRYCLFVWRTIAVGPFTTNFLRPLSFSEPHCWQTPRRPRLTTYTRRKNFLAEPSFRVLRQPYSCFERTSVSGTGEELHPTRPGNSVASQNSSKIIDNAAETSDGNAEEELIDVEVGNNLFCHIPVYRRCFRLTREKYIAALTSSTGLGCHCVLAPF